MFRMVSADARGSVGRRLTNASKTMQDVGLRMGTFTRETAERARLRGTICLESLRLLGGCCKTEHQALRAVLEHDAL